MASIKEVAKAAGVSVATVSRVINGSDAVTEATKRSVRAAIERLGYKPNFFGKNLRSRETKTIMVMLSSLANTFCSNVIRSIDKIAGENGYYTVICTTDGLRERELHYTSFACSGLFDGLIILNSNLAGNEVAELAGRIPVVQCNEFTNTRHAPYVSIDNEQAAYDAVSLLIANGRRRIVFHTVDNTLMSTRERLKGYKRALSEKRIPFDENLVLWGNYGWRNAERVFGEFIRTGCSFDGVFAVSDRMAAGDMHAILRAGRRVPEDAEIIGFDNTDISYTSTPGLTTVSQPHSLLGKCAFELLKKVVAGEMPESIILPHEIVRRESTR